MVNRTMAARKRWKGNPEMVKRVFDVELGELKKDAIGVVSRIWKHFGIELSDSSREHMKAWMAMGQVHYGQHSVRLEDFGLTKEDVMASPIFKEYCREFEVPD